MPVSIRNLTIVIKIGGQDIILDSDSINQDPNNAGSTIKDLLAKGFSFKMQKGTSISVTVGEMVTWFKTNFSGHVDSLEGDVRNFIGSATTTPNTPPANWQDGVLIELRDLSFSARKPKTPQNAPAEISFGFTLKVELDDTFYDNLGLDAITDIISVTSVGFSMSYSNN